MPPDRTTPLQPAYPMVPHYYGDIARRLFLGGAIVMLLSLPLEKDILPTVFTVVIVIALFLTFLAGFTSPKKRFIIGIDTLVAALMFILFEYTALTYLSSGGNAWSVTFLVQELLALNFLIAFYFCSKTWRELPQRNHD